MFGTKSFMNFFNEKTGIQFNGFWLLYRSCHILIHLTLMAMCLGFSLSFLPETANAATVYGHIYCSEDMSCPQKITLLIYQGERQINRVRTDNKGNYRVFLSPGRYEVKMNFNGKSWGTTIRSSSNPIRQDIYPHRME